MEENQKQEVYSFEVGDSKIRFVEAKEKQADFEVDVKYRVNLFGESFGISETIINTWIIMAVLIVFALITRIALFNFKKVPKGFQNFIEALVGGFESFVSSTMGEANKRFAAFYGGMFLFILFANLSGLFALRPPTADLATTFALALITFLMIQGFAIKSKGFRKYLKGFFEPMPFLFPINLVGELATPISLSFRLFGNILGGTIIMGLFYSMPYIFAQIGIPAVLHAYFDLFAGALQTLIFVMLSMTFVGQNLESEDSN